MRLLPGLQPGRPRFGFAATRETIYKRSKTGKKTRGWTVSEGNDPKKLVVRERKK